MKIFICCLLVAAELALTLAKESIVASDKSGDSKPKTYGSLLGGSYQGASYKYLPPSMISSYDAYAGNIGSLAGYNGGHAHSVGSGFSHGYKLLPLSSKVHHNSGSIHGLGYAPSASYHSNGQHGLSFLNGGLKNAGGSHNSALFGHTQPHLYAVGHGYSSLGASSSGLGYKPHLHSISGANLGLGNSYHYPKDFGGSFSYPASAGFGYGSSHNLAPALAEVRDGDHVHNGFEKHFYVITKSIGIPVHSAPESSDITATSYIPPVQQYPLPTGSYVVPTANSQNTKYNSHTIAVIEKGPSYAAGHKGLGHFSFTANKPQVLHTSITGSSLKSPSYSKAPFKPSIFLGAKYEDTNHYDALGQQYLLPSVTANYATGYDYQASTGPSINYLEPTAAVQTTSVYLPANRKGSFDELSSATSKTYLTPTNTIPVPYTD